MNEMQDLILKIKKRISEGRSSFVCISADEIGHEFPELKSQAEKLIKDIRDAFGEARACDEAYGRPTLLSRYVRHTEFIPILDIVAPQDWIIEASKLHQSHEALRKMRLEWLDMLFKYYSDKD